MDSKGFQHPVWRVLLSVFAVILIGGCRGQQVLDVEETPLMKAVRLLNEQRFEEAYDQFGRARIFAHIEHNEENEFAALKGQADCAFWIGYADGCIDSYLKALPLAQKLNKQYDEFVIYLQLKQAYLAKVDMQNVMWASKKADSLAKVSPDMRLTIGLQRQLAQEALQQNNPYLAEYYYWGIVSLLDSICPELRLYEQITAYEDLCNYYIGQHNFEKARECNLKMIATAKDAFGKHQLTYMQYGREALICAQLHNREDAFKALDSIKYGLTLEAGDGDANMMQYHKVKGDVHSMFGEWRKACREYRKALKSIDDTIAQYRVDYYRIVRDLGWALCNRGKYDEARDCLLEVIDYSIVYGHHSLAFANAIWDLACLERICGNRDTARRAFESSVELCKQTVTDQLKYVSPQERETFWFSFAPKMYGMTAYALQINDRQSRFTEKCYEALLFSKGLLLESDKAMAETINEECTPEEQNVYSEMLRLQNQLKALSNNYEKNREQIDVLHRKISIQNQLLTPIVSRLGYTTFLDVRYKDIKGALKDDEVLLDFADFITEDHVHRYAAFVVDRGHQFPKLIDVFTEEQVDYLLSNKPLYQMFKTPNAEKMHELIWRPLAKEVQGKRTIYYVPSGVMHQISLEDIPLKDGTLLRDHYRFVRLTSARETIKNHGDENHSKRASATLYGGLKYDMDTIQMIDEASHHHLNRQFVQTRGSALNGTGVFRELPNTKKEIDRIEAILRRNHFSVTSNTGIKGTEESFLELSKKAPNILHIATHGFYYTADKANETNYLKGYNDAMMLSGLIMSGGDLAWSGKKLPNGVLSGVLTANKIASMDLKGADLVVLSACRTGLGKATPEGIYGLQRAFKKAGAQTIVMSLWDISDHVTTAFMVNFYEELTNKHNHGDKRLAFNKAKDSIRNNPNYCDPYYWAGFVMLD